MEGPAQLAAKAGLEYFVKDGNEAVEFRLISKVQDLDNPKLAFRPAMSHQIFGEGETIFGYANLTISIFFTAGSLLPFVAIKYTKKINPDLADGVEADDILEKLSPKLPANYLTNLDQFSGVIDKETEKFRPLGELINSFIKDVNFRAEMSQNGQGDSNGTKFRNGHGQHAAEPTFEVYCCDLTTPKFKEYLQRMQAFGLSCIEDASILDSDDEKWKFFVIYEKSKTSDGSTFYTFVGYSTVYNFFCYPDGARPRITQMITLSPFQGYGVGMELLSTIYGHYRANPGGLKVFEITLEGSSDGFELTRDFVDARDCLKLPSFTPEKLKQGFSVEMKNEAREVLKITGRQARRVYEILRLRITNVNDEKEFKSFRLDVKGRLNEPYKKQQKDIERLKKKNFNTAELQKAEILDEGSRLTELESNFQNLYAHYRKVVGRLANIMKYGNINNL